MAWGAGAAPHKGSVLDWAIEAWLAASFASLLCPESGGLRQISGLMLIDNESKSLDCEGQIKCFSGTGLASASVPSGPSAPVCPSDSTRGLCARRMLEPSMRHQFCELTRRSLARVSPKGLCT